eukprot:CAMPEP_0177638538 /NCGR_PEP_ID=MMETSP0447-20121125/5541_1 /TAXON_ID=0 /ORGANISM="Stygamoeba regulata, Strain BSH-02190019" /LENGTH=2427 /DNA_ID=CAMNT_0019140505 /DNA_START=274 /DNA_END=7558 /DNA_ORIENTATION=+
MALSLRVELPGGQVKTMRFSSDMTVSDMVEDIHQKTGKGGPDHGMFLPPEEGVRNGMWLDEDKTLVFYDLQSGDLVMYKKKHRVMKFQLLDGTIKSLMINESRPVVEIVENVCESIGVNNPEEFALQVEGSGAEDWLSSTGTIHEQGVAEDALLVLRKRFFYTDANVDTSDPMQLHLLYVQTRDAVLAGKHPLKREQAVDLASLQAQVQHGTYDPHRHKEKENFLKLEEMLPEAWGGKKSKRKKVGTDVYKAWRNLAKMNEANAKYRYIQVCRSLPTWGITFFQVKHIVPAGKKKKLLDRLLGITRDSIMMMDMQREVLDSHPLTHLKRWSAGQKTFTLDFGDHADDYTNLFTLEGQKISELISGYIDIILKKRIQGPKRHIEDGSKRATKQHIAPTRGQAAVAQTTSLGSGHGAPNHAALGQMGAQGQGMGRLGQGGPGQYGAGGPGQGQAEASVWGSQELVTDVGSAIDGIDFLLQNAEAAPLPMQMLSPQDILGQMAASNQRLGQAANQLMQNYSQLTPEQLLAQARNIHLNVADMLRTAQAAAANDDIDVSLLEAVSAILQCTRQLNANPQDQVAYQRLLHSRQLYQVAQLALQANCRGVLCDAHSTALVGESARAVHSATSRVVDALRLAQLPEAHCAVLADMGKHTADLAHAIGSAVCEVACQTALNESIAKLHAQAAQLIQYAQANCKDESVLCQVKATAAAISTAIAQLQAATNSFSVSAQDNADQFPVYLKRAHEAVQLVIKDANSAELVQKHSKRVLVLGQSLLKCAASASQLVPDEQRDELMAAVRRVGVAVRDLMGAAQQSQTNPGDSAAQGKLTQDAKLLSSALYTLDECSGRATAYGVLRDAARHAASGLTALSSVCVASAVHLSGGDGDADKDAEGGRTQQLLESAQATATQVCALVQEVQRSHQEPSSGALGQQLFRSARATAHPGSQLVMHASKAVPALEDPHQRHELDRAAQAAQSALQQLLEACREVTDRTGGKEIQSAQQKLSQGLAELSSLQLAAEGGMMAANQEGEDPAQAFAAVYEAVRHSLTGVGAVNQAAHQEVGAMPAAATQTADGLLRLVEGTRRMATALSEREAQVSVLGGAKALLTDVNSFLGVARAVLADPSTTLQQELQEKARQVSERFKAYLDVAKGAGAGSQELEKARQAIEEQARRLEADQAAEEFAHPDQDFLYYARALRQFAGVVAGSAQQVAAGAAATDARELQVAASTSAASFAPFVAAAGNASASCTHNPKAREALLTVARLIAQSMSQLVQAATTAKTDARAKQSLDTAAAQVEQQIARLSQLLDLATPGKLQLLRAQQQVRDALESTNATSVTTNATSTTADKTQAQQQQQQQPLPVATLLEAARQLSTQVAGVLGASRKSPERMAALGTEAANQLEAVLRVAHSFDLAGDAARCSAEQLGQALLGLLGTMSALADEPESKAARNELMRHSKAVGEALRRLVQDGRQLVPAQAECQAAQDAVQSALERLEEADFQVMSGMPGQPSQPQRSHGDFARALVAAAAGLGRHGEELVRHGLGDRAADGEQQDGEASAEQQQQQRLPESVSATAAGLPALVTAAVDAAFTTSGDTQQAVLGMAREAVSALQSALQAVSQCAADPHNEERRAELRAAGEQLQAQVSQLSATMQEGVSALALCDDALIKLRSCAHSLETDGGAAAGTAAGASLTYHQCQDQLVAALKEVTLHSAEAARYAPRGDLDRTAGSLGLLASDVERLTELCGRAAQRVRQDHQRQKLVRALAGVAQSSAQLGEQCRELGVDRQNAAKQAKAAATLKEARQQVDVAVGALREAAVAEQRCEQAAEQAAAAVQRLDSAALMLASGERESVPVAAAAAGPSSSSSAASSSSSAASSSLAASSLEEQCARVEKASAAVRKQVDAVRLAVEGGEESALGEAAETLGEAVSEFAAQSRALLWHLPEAEDQQGLLGSAKLVAMSVQSLALSAHQAQGYPERQGTRDAFERASASALDSVAALGAVVERSTGELIRTAREAHEAERGLRTQLDALDASAAAGSAAGSAAGNQKATAEDVIQQLRAVARSTAATAQAAGSSQAELLEGLATLSAASQAAVRDVHGALRLLGEQPKQRQQLAYATRAAGEAVCGFMRAVGEYRGDDQQSRARLSTHSSKVADHLQSVVVAARALPGGENLELEENDLSQMAEKELLLAAQMIEEAAKRLLTLERPVALDPIKLNEHEIASAILSAARAITTNSSFLIQAAIQMQKELVAHGQAGGRGENAYNKDPAWAQGLISAAQAVAGTTEDLVTYANDAARGEAGDEMVIAAVQQVGAAVTRLVTASRVKADPNSPSLRKLEQASKAVTTSTQHLMSAATRAMKGGAAGGAAAPSAADKASAVKARSSRIAEIERRAQIIKLQRQLEEAQREVTRANKAKYSGAGAASAGPSAKQ